MAIGETVDGKWTFKRRGFFRPYITVRPAGADADIAILRRSGRRESRLEFSDRRAFVWKPTRSCRREMGFFETSGELVVSFRPESSLFKYQASMVIPPGKADSPALSLLALLGYYQMVLEYEEAAAASAAAAAAAAAG